MTRKVSTLHDAEKTAWLESSFAACDQRETGEAEPGWEEHKRLLTRGGGMRWT